MADDLLFRVEGAKATPTERISLADAGLKERSDLQEWVIAHPEVLGADVMVVTFEFDRWSAAGGKAAPADRLDVLGLDRNGRLVVVELKRDRAPDTTDMQAIKYAAMASRFTPEVLASYHARYLSRSGGQVPDTEASERLLEHAAELSAETLRTPRIILMARDFSPAVTASCVWLSEMGLDIQLIKFQAYRSDDQVLLTVSQLFPVPDIEDFMVSPRQSEIIETAVATKQTRERSAVKRIVEGGLLDEGAELSLVIGPGVSGEVHAGINEWVANDERRGRASWTNSPTTPLIWEFDGKSYSPSGLAQQIVREAVGLDRSLQGTTWWSDDDGRTLVQVAGEASGPRQARYMEFWGRFLDRVREEHPDWTSAQIPPGKSWFAMPGPRAGTRHSVNFPSGHRLRAEFYIGTGDKATNKQIFDSLYEQRARIEAEYGGELSWERLDHRKASRIAAYRPDSDIDQAGEYEEYIDWFITAGKRLRDALRTGVTNHPLA